MNNVCRNCAFYERGTPQALFHVCNALPPVLNPKTNTFVRPRVSADTTSCRYFIFKEIPA